MRNKYLPVMQSKKNCFFLLSLILCLYIIENSAVLSFIDNTILTYFVKSFLWLGVAYIAWLFPKTRSNGKLKFKNLLNVWAFNFAIIYIIISILGGLIDGFGKSPYSHSPMGIIINIISISSMLLAREMIRSYATNTLAKQENYIVFIIIALFMTFLSFPFKKYTDFRGNIDIIKFIAQYFGPELCKNLLATYLVFLGGTMPSIIYLGIVEAFSWLSPILPDMKWITQAFVGILCPMFCFMVIQNIYLTASKQIKKDEKSKESSVSWMVTCLISIGIIWFSVGVFPIYPSVIATGSMEPMIMPGDVILVQKADGNKVKLDDVIQFKRDNMLISHRIIEIVEKENVKGYRTKGDNNSCADAELVKPEQVKGKVIKVVPKIGWPTLLIKSKKDEATLKKVQF